MAQMTFLINDSSAGGDSPVLQVTISENPDGSLTFGVTQLGGYVGDLRGLFFDVADESLLGHLTATGTGLTGFLQGNDSVTDLGGGSNMNGQLGGDSGYDAGVEIGDSGLKGGSDDFRAFTFTLSSDLRALTLQDFSTVSFGARITSVGIDSNLDGAFETSRTLSAKTGEVTFAVIAAQDDVAALNEDARLTGNVLGNDGAGASDVLTVTGWSGGDLGVSCAVEELGFATITVNADGSYWVDASATDGLAAGETLSHVFTYDVLQTNADGTSAHTVSFKVTVTGTNDAPVIAGEVFAGGVEEAGSNADTGVLGAGGSFGFDDLDLSDAHSVAFAPVGATLGTLAALGVDRAAAGTGAGSISWAYAVDADRVAYLGAGETLVEEFVVTVSDAAGGTDTATVRVTVTGSNDAPVIAGAAFTAGVDEAGSNADTGTLGTGGSFSFDDADLSDAHAVTFTPSGTTLGTLSALSITAAATGAGAGTVEWTYAVDADKVAYLAVGESLVEEFLVTVDDDQGGSGVTMVRVTVTGSNDAPTLAGEAFAGAVDEAESDTGVLGIAGSISFDDADLTDVHAVTFMPVGTTLGTLTLLEVADAASGPETGTVAWTYAVDAEKVAHLAAGETRIEEFLVTLSDGEASDTATVHVTITGSNDGVRITSGAQQGAATEDDDTQAVDASGTVSFTDADLRDGHTASFVAAAANATALGSLALTGVSEAAGAAGGSVGWSYTLDNAAADHLAAGEQVSETYSIILDDGNGSTTAQDVTVTITGTNDAVRVTSGVQAGAARENDDTQAVDAGGTVSFTDADLRDGHTASFVAAAANGTALGMFALAGVNEAAGAAGGSVGWSYTLDNAAASYLGAGQQVTETYTIVVDDGNGSTATQDVTVTIIGTNDAPVIRSAVASGAAAEDGPLSAGGLITFSDGNLGDAHTVSAAANGAGYLGTFSASVTDPATGDGTGGVHWAFSMDNASVQHLRAGELLTQAYTVTVSDGHGGTAQQEVTVTIAGRNDAPTTQADSAATLEDTAVTLDVRLNDHDKDAGDTLTVTRINGAPIAANGTVALANGASVRLNTDGTLTYTPGANENGTKSFSYTVADSSGATATGNASVAIAPVNDAPVANDDVNIKASLVSNSGFEATPNFSGWTVDHTPSSNFVFGPPFSSATIQRNATTGNAIAVLDFGGSISTPGGTGWGPTIRSDAFTAAAGDTVSFDWLLSSGGDWALGNGYIRDASNGAVIATVFNYNTGFSGSTGWRHTDVNLGSNGTFYMEFRIGSYDSTFGQYVGATLQLDFAGVLPQIHEDKVLTIKPQDLIGNDRDPDGNPLTIADVADHSALGAQVRVNADGTISYDPTAALNGLDAGQTVTDSFSYTVSDGQGGTDTASVSFTIQGRGDAVPAEDDFLVGTSGADNLNGAAGADVLAGLGGDDVMTGGTGNDTFLISPGSGRDTVTDFQSADVIKLIDLGWSGFSDVIDHATQDGANAVIDLNDGNTLTLIGVNVSSLQADDFWLL